MSDDEKKPGPAYEPALPAGVKIWTHEEHAILKKFLPKYNETPGKERATWILQNPAQEIRKLTKAFSKKKMTDENKLLWDKKCEQIKNWYYNQNQKDRKITIPGIDTSVSFRHVFSQVKKKEIMDEAKRLAEADDYSKNSNKKDPTFPYYQSARKNIEDNLTEAEREEIENQREEWETSAPPHEIQLQTIKKKGHRIVVAMDRIKFNSMGMRTLSLECHPGPNGDMRFSTTETKGLGNDPTNAPSFQEFAPAAFAAVTQEWVKYADHLLLLESNPAADTDPQHPPRKFETAHLKFNSHGLPNIPGPIKNTNGNETADTRQSILRTIFNKHCELAGGPSKVPYSKIVDRPWDFTSKEYFPEKLTLKDPCDYKHHETKDILTLWRKRQAERKIPFRWTHIAVGDETRTAAYPKDIFDGLTAHTGEESEESSDSDEGPPVIIRRKPKNIDMNFFETDDDSDTSGDEIADVSLLRGTSKMKATKVNDGLKEEEKPETTKLANSATPTVKKEAKSVSPALKKEAKSVIPALKKEAQAVTDALKADVKPVTKENVVAGKSGKKDKKLSTKKEQNAVASSSKAAEKINKKRKAAETLEVTSPKKSRLAPVTPKDSDSKEAEVKEKESGPRKSSRVAVRKVRPN